MSFGFGGETKLVVVVNKDIMLCFRDLWKLKEDTNGVEDFERESEF